MAIGAEDYVDQLLVEKYAEEKVDNHENMTSMIQPETMMSAMNDYSLLSRNMFVLNKKLTAACSALNALNVQYREIQPLEPVEYDEY